MNRKLSVMLVDDNEFDLFLFEKLLEIKNISRSISKHSHVASAIEFLINCAPSEWPELILLDIHMPLLTGFDFLDRYEEIVNKNGCTSYIFMISSSLDAGDNKKAEENPLVLSLLTKPVNMDKMIAILETKGL